MNEAQPSGSVLSLRGLSVGYPEKVILEGIDLECEAGQFIALLGPNGAGKTTLLRTLARLLTPRGGTVLLDEKSLDQIRHQELAKRLSVVLTGQTAPGLMDAFQFVSLGRYPHTGLLGSLRPGDIRATEESLALVNAGDLAHRRMQALSDGERQKIFIARALAQEPRVILLDEPTLHLDLKHRMEVMGIMQRLCREKGITVVASMHDVDIAAKVADRVALIRKGGVMAWGAPEEVLREETVRELYGFRDAAFNPWLGSIELSGCNGAKGPIFVAGGVGTGAMLYRMLVRRGFAVSTGVLHANDLDAYVAQSLGLALVPEAPMKPVSDEAYHRALALLGKATCIVDSGFPVEDLNRRNLDLIRAGLGTEKPVFSLRCSEEIAPIGKDSSLLRSAVVSCSSETEILERIEAVGERRCAVR